jgi:hypothetical protein
MAKVTITIEDADDQSDQIKINFAFNPELPKAEGDAPAVPLTAAQKVAYSVYTYLESFNDEDENQDDEFAGETLEPRSCSADDAGCESCQ